MRITSICADRSDASRLVLRTEPPLTAEVLNQFRQVPQPQALSGFAFSAESGCLIVHNVIPASLAIDADIAAEIRQLLNQAEQAANDTAKLVREAIEREKTEKLASLQAAIKAFEVPAE